MIRVLTDGCELWCCLVIFIHSLNGVIRSFKNFHGKLVLSTKFTKMCQSYCGTDMFLGMYRGSNVVFFFFFGVPLISVPCYNLQYIKVPWYCNLVVRVIFHGL